MAVSNSKKAVLALLEAVEPSDEAVADLAANLIFALAVLCLMTDDSQEVARRVGDELQKTVADKRRRKRTADMRFCHLVGRLH